MLHQLYAAVRSPRTPPHAAVKPVQGRAGSRDKGTDPSLSREQIRSDQGKAPPGCPAERETHRQAIQHRDHLPLPAPHPRTSCQSAGTTAALSSSSQRLLLLIIPFPNEFSSAPSTEASISSASSNRSCRQL